MSSSFFFLPLSFLIVYIMWYISPLFVYLIKQCPFWLFLNIESWHLKPFDFCIDAHFYLFFTSKETHALKVLAAVSFEHNKFIQQGTILHLYYLDFAIFHVDPRPIWLIQTNNSSPINHTNIPFCSIVSLPLHFYFILLIN